jgi:hypothetical protein
MVLMRRGQKPRFGCFWLEPDHSCHRIVSTATCYSAGALEIEVD